jgi:hypothetical protein
MSFDGPQNSFKPSIPTRIANIARIAMPVSTYDPVPPYDLDDIESSAPRLSNDRISVDTTAALSENTERPNDDHQTYGHRQEHQNNRRKEVYCAGCNRHMGRLSSRERCNYALLILAMILFSLTICTSIIVSAFKAKA